MKRFIPFVKSDPVVSVVRLSGTIASGGRVGGVLNDAALEPVIERAFSRRRPRAVALLINSPGGSPVQSALIAARIRRLAGEKTLPVHAFVEDVAASGGYWLASAADHIWLDQSSIVGSIGVISAGFGFQELISRYGIERRLYTAGRSKALLDPFSPQKREDVKRLNELLEQIHDSFIAQVKERRGTRLNGGDDLFNGDIWIGQKAVDLGLADGLAHLVPKMKEIYGDKVKLVPYGLRRPFFQRLGAQVVNDAIDAVEERALWSRYGL
ncbi:S49 family peptidase [Alkalilacustris brevis]|uniref:S49 family peptidase n=1 Tax=Alkalilacustris brevis TaxID=2026338 RepID=UPI000E0DB9C2|nr:S49 family peptidase [Alkalilacustris brevis]